TQYDQLNVTGTVAVGGNLNVSVENGFTPAIGDVFTILTNDGTDPISGTFNGLPQGGLVNYGGNIFAISYTGGTNGNDITLTAQTVNQFPTANAQTVSVNEDGSIAITLTGTDLDGDAIAFSIETNPTHGTLTGTGAIRTYTPNPNFNGTDSFVFRVTDTPGGFGTATVSITVNPQPDAPQQVNLSNNTVAENSSSGTVIGTLSTVDVDAADTFEYELVSGNGSTHNNLFTISGNELKLAFIPNFESGSVYSVRVRSTDSGNLSVDRVFTINITDVNEAPVSVSLQNTVTSIREDVSTTTAIRIADIQVSDDGLGSENFSLSGADADSFEIVAGSLYLKSGVVLNAEAYPTLSVTVLVDDPTVGLTPDVSALFSLTVLPANSPATLVVSVVEDLRDKQDTAGGVTVGTFTHEDPNDSDPVDTGLGSSNHTFSFSGPDAEYFSRSGTSIIFDAGVITESAQSSFTATLELVDGPFTLTQSFTIDVLTLQEQINNAPNNSTLNVLPGEYSSISIPAGKTLTINGGGLVTIRSASPALTVDGAALTVNGVAFLDSSDLISTPPPAIVGKNDRSMT
ncbi:MAG: Ig-like domain-containing protein, partial [Planctomyces sp.]